MLMSGRPGQAGPGKLTTENTISVCLRPAGKKYRRRLFIDFRCVCAFKNENFILFTFSFELLY